MFCVMLIVNIHLQILKTRPDQAGGGEGNDDDENSDPAPPPDSPSQRKNIRVAPTFSKFSLLITLKYT